MRIKTSVFIRLSNILKPINLIINYISNFIWYNYPFGYRPLGSENDYLKLSQITKNQKYPEIDIYEKSKGIAIDKGWLDQLALKTQITIKKSKLCYAHGRLLYTSLSDFLIKKSKELKNEKIFILETGTARGFSAVCMSKALEDSKKDGLIITFDVLPHSTKMFWNTIDDITKGPQTRSQLLDDWEYLCKKYILFHQGDTRLELNKIYLKRVHFAFLDGAHTYKDVMFEFNQIKEKQMKGDIIVYDDYNEEKFPGIVNAVNKICQKYNYDKMIIKSSNERGYVIATKN